MPSMPLVCHGFTASDVLQGLTHLRHDLLELDVGSLLEELSVLLFDFVSRDLGASGVFVSEGKNHALVEELLENPARRVQRDCLQAHCRAEEVSATVRPFAFGRSPHFVRVGLYFMGCPVHSVPAQPHKTEPRFQGMQYKNAASLRPKGSLSLTH